MPKKLMQDIFMGKEREEHEQMSELMRYDTSGAMSADEAAQENPENV
jgi:hypothetical protein